jgi:Domain of unknown function (DUF1995)
MAELPQTLDDAIGQAQQATKAAIAAGYQRLQVEFLFPELKVMPVANKFIPGFTEYGSGLKVFFTDAGLAALARRDWQDTTFSIRSLDVAGSRQTTTVEEQIDPQDQLYLFMSPTAVEVAPVEQICQAAEGRPVVLLNPRLEDVAIIGIGYAGRQIRERFLNTIEPCYYLRPLDDRSALLRCYPDPWQVWLEQDGVYQLIAEEYQKPDTEKLDAIFAQTAGAKKLRQGLFSGLNQLFRALGR